MNYLLVFLFTLSLFYFAVVLLAIGCQNAINKYNQKQATPNSFLQKVTDKLQVLQTENTRNISGHVALLIGLWNLFAPDFGSFYGGITIFGALIPSIIVILDAFILAPTMIDWIPSEKIKAHLVLTLEKTTAYAGWATLAAAVVHLFFFKLPLF